MKKLFPVLILFILSSGFSNAKDLGVYGNLYRIEEVDLLAYIEEKAETVNSEEIEKGVRGKFELSLEVSLNILEAKERRTRYVDPSIIISSPLYDHEGHVVAASGNLNPLERINLSSAIVVIGESQLPVISEIKKSHNNILILLTEGNLKRSVEAAGQMVYKADRNILGRLGVEVIPSIVTQDGKRLKIEEVPFKEKGD